MHKKLVVFFLVLFFSIGYSQNVKLSAYSEVSIITSGPGEELYEKFGHTAIRIKDPVLQLDLIYNYGIFDFSAPNFYLKFIKGFMNYKLARYDFYHSLKNANKHERWVKEQILNLTTEEKNKFFFFLEQNAAPENASYLYDPYFNNCATKPRDIIKEILGDKLNLANKSITHNSSLRQLMNVEIAANTWGNFGINMALGNTLDKKATTESAMYLPDYVYSVLEQSTIKRNAPVPLVKKVNILLNFNEKPTKIDFINPFLIFSILLVISVFITFNDLKNKKRTKWFDFLIFFTTGIIGVLIVFLWFFTNHSTAPNNFNFLWAFAPNILVAFFMIQQNPPKWISKYIFILLLLIVVGIPIIWLTGIQLFSPYLLLILGTLICRYALLFKTLNS